MVLINEQEEQSIEAEFAISAIFSDASVCTLNFTLTGENGRGYWTATLPNALNLINVFALTSSIRPNRDTFANHATQGALVAVLDVQSTGTDGLGIETVTYGGQVQCINGNTAFLLEPAGALMLGWHGEISSGLQSMISILTMVTELASPANGLQYLVTTPIRRSSRR